MIRKNQFGREVVSDKQFVSDTPMFHSSNFPQLNSEAIMRKHAAVRAARRFRHAMLIFGRMSCRGFYFTPTELAGCPVSL
jgi:hypothetical protein